MTEDTNIYRTLGPIYISSIQPLLNEEDLFEKYKIKTIISITKSNIPSKYKISPYDSYLQIPIDDLPSEVIIPYFSQINKLITETIYKQRSKDEIEHTIIEGTKPAKLELSGNAVLIHCQSGISRSVSFVCAYLMNRYNLSLNHALHAIRRNNSTDHLFQPNDGFIEQLEIYKENNWIVDLVYLRKKSSHWRAYRMEYLMSNLLSNKQTDSQFSNIQNDDNDNIKDENWFGFKCCKCRALLASSEVYIPHAPPFDKDDKQMYFTKNAFKSKRVVNRQIGQNECTQIFTEPLTWMRDKISSENDIGTKEDNNSNIMFDNLEGRLDCYKCGNKVGGWNWKGERCSCGKWMVPAIHLLKSKVIQVDRNNKLILPNDDRAI